MFTLNHFVRKTFRSSSGKPVQRGPKASGVQKRSDQAEYSKGSEVISSEATKASPEDRLFFGMCRLWATQACRGKSFLPTGLAVLFASHGECHAAASLGFVVFLKEVLSFVPPGSSFPWERLDIFFFKGCF